MPPARSTLFPPVKSRLRYAHQCAILITVGTALPLRQGTHEPDTNMPKLGTVSTAPSPLIPWLRAHGGVRVKLETRNQKPETRTGGSRKMRPFRYRFATVFQNAKF